MLIERWIIKAPQKIIPPLRNSESKAPQKILMIRFETKTCLMENQVKLSCFSPVSVHLEIWLQLFWRLLDQNQSRFDSEAAAEAKRAFTDKTLWTLNQRQKRWRDWVWNSSFDHVYQAHKYISLRGGSDPHCKSLNVSAAHLKSVFKTTAPTVAKIHSCSARRIPQPSLSSIRIPHSPVFLSRVNESASGRWRETLKRARAKNSI